MFPMMGYYGTNPFCCRYGFSMSPEVGFFLGLAAATAVQTSYAAPKTNNQQTLNQTQSTYTNQSVGNFGSLTASLYNNNNSGFGYFGSFDNTMPYYPTTFVTPDIAITAANLADRIVNNINAQMQVAAQAQAQAQAQAKAQAQAQAQAQTQTQSQSASQSSDTPSSTSQTTVNEPQGGDLKPGLFKGRLAGQEALVTRICRKYGVSPALVASIIGLESGWGTSDLAMHNNFGGYRAAGDLGKNEKGFGYFSTIEKGLEAMIKNLADYTRYNDVAQVNFNNLDSIGRHYCEGGVWSGRVRHMYNSRVNSYIA